MEFRGSGKRVIVFAFFGVCSIREEGIVSGSMWIAFEELIDYFFIVFFVLL